MPDFPVSVSAHNGILPICTVSQQSPLVLPLKTSSSVGLAEHISFPAIKAVTLWYVWLQEVLQPFQHFNL